MVADLTTSLLTSPPIAATPIVSTKSAPLYACSCGKRIVRYGRFPGGQMGLARRSSKFRPCPEGGRAPAEPVPAAGRPVARKSCCTLKSERLDAAASSGYREGVLTNGRRSRLEKRGVTTTPCPL